MLATTGGVQTLPPREQPREQQPGAPGRPPIEYALETSDGAGHGDEVRWTVRLSVEDSMIRREVRLDESGWTPDLRSHGAETIIWPTWPGAGLGEDATKASPLEGVRDYWSEAGTKLRDSAKWMSAVLGAALATLVGTSPLSATRLQAPSVTTAACGAAGLVLLGCTMFLVLQVMRPRSISFSDVQVAGGGHRRLPGNPLRHWKDVVESQQDLYLPCGVQTLTDLRQAMIVEEITLIALSRGISQAGGDPGRAMMLCDARNARAARLQELRDAAAQVATIGEYYHLRYRSAWATYCGILCGLLGAAAVIAAFTWSA
jgi:hypothetical protein